MDKLQADAIAQAMLEPDRAFQEQLRLRRAAEERSLADRRKVAWYVLGGAAVGTIVALMAGVRFTNGIVWGGIAGATIGWAVVLWRNYRDTRKRRMTG